MNDDSTYIIKSRDLAEIIKNPDKNAIAELLEDPGAVIAAALTDLLTSGPVAFFAPGIRIAQAAFKGETFRQLGAEVKLLRAKGILTQDFERNKSGYQTWVELLTIIDEDTPDEGRLEALKAMFLASNKINATDGELVLGYQLFQIAKRLSSNELLVLKAAFELQESNEITISPMSQREWVNTVAKRLGHNLTALVRHAEKILVDAELIDQANNYTVQGHRLTDLGMTFCKNIKTYRVEIDRAKIKSSA
ncbi:MAG TPA: hypothetical protein VGH51_04725 [Candidatus Angelobacter sp.]|jgi:hypothetical protein